MKRSDIHQKVLNALGKILVDKDPIREQVTLAELILDDTDLSDFFNLLQQELDSGVTLPPTVKSVLLDHSEHPLYRELTLDGLVDLIQKKLEDRKKP